ncbi:hypothetical protein HNQ65_004850 [Prosthecobacter vanneervenii]|uniref:Uncharacterized protein n=1 Tax=Prosthecobacter vanneervenii TaxID=48466 RepID=A0A7W8DMW1_9BACT|nr:hypothetical protein [Prosthecobacter vanneervenii]
MKRNYLVKCDFCEGFLRQTSNPVICEKDGYLKTCYQKSVFLPSSC